jgi:DNA-binding transcriptional LysR family regulator
LSLSPSAVSHGLGRLRRLLNDPLFLRTPRGVVPTARALELGPPVAEVLARVRAVVGSAAPFDARSSTRRFAIGAPDGAAAVFLPRLLTLLRKRAPGIDIATRQALPREGVESIDEAWRAMLEALEARALDVAVLPVANVPARFESQLLYAEDFAIAVRAGHPFIRRPTLPRYVSSEHLVVSQNGDPTGFVDVALAKQGLSRRVTLTVPSFSFALSLVADSDLLCAVPRRLLTLHAKRLGLRAVDAPLELPTFRLHAIASRAAMMDAGIAWLMRQLVASSAA